MSVAGAHHQLMSSCLPSRLSRVRFPSPAPPPVRRYSARKARAAEGRPPAFQAGCQRSQSKELRYFYRLTLGAAVAAW